MSSKGKLDNIYDNLFDLYKNNYDKYIQDAVKSRDVIKTLKPEPPDVYRPYPKITDARFNEKLSKKHEFNSCQLSPEYSTNNDFDSVAATKCSQTDFKLTNNQKFIKRFLSPLTPYNGLLLFHGVGVGKTCTAIGIAEQYLLNPKAKRVMVILSSNIKDNFKKQLFDINNYNLQTNESVLCTGTKYPDMIIDKRLITPEAITKRINKIIKERYQFVGYKELVSMMTKLNDQVKKNEKNPEKHQQRFEDKIKEVFSDRLIIIDEAHNLRLPSESGKKQISAQLLQILQVASDIKLVLLSATPMYNNAKEIIYMLNLLLTNDRRSISFKGVFDKNGYLTNEGKKTLIKASRGYVSYMRGENPFSFPFRLYPSINKDSRVIKKFPMYDAKGEFIDKKIEFLDIIGSKMSDIQKNIYDIMKGDVQINDDDEDDEVAPDEVTGALQNTLQLSNIVYPYDSLPTSDHPKILAQYYGKGGFDRCFDKRDKKEIKYRSSVVQDFGQFLAYDKIGDYSPKIKTILDYIINSQGIVFIYSQYYYSGIYPLAIALEHIGFTKYKHGSNNRNIASNLDISPKFPRDKTPSYVILSRDKDISPNNDQEIADIKAKSNKNGEIIKVVIVSKVGTEGIDFKRIREVHVLEPWFNLNRTEQIVGRAVRTCSHIDLPKEERNVTVFLHATEYTDKEESIDIKTYRIAEKKQKVINDVQRVLKEGAIDCNLNVTNLIYPIDKVNMKIDIKTSQGKVIKGYSIGDRDGSHLCDYGECEMKCSTSLKLPSKKDADMSTFDPFFIIDDIDLYKKYISQLFKEKDNYRFGDIFKSLVDKYGKDSIDEDIVGYALQEMVDTQYKFLNSSGYNGYILYRGDLYIFHDTRYLETKLTLEELKDMKRKSRLDISVLGTKILKKRASDETSQNDSKKNNINKDTKVFDYKVYEDMKVELETLIKTIIGGGNITREVKIAILESIIDRIPLHDIAQILISTHKNDIYNALMNSPFVLIDKDKPTHIYNSSDNMFYSLNSEGTLKVVGPLEYAKIKSKADAIKKALEAGRDDFKGSLGFSKQGDPTFKVRDNIKSKGFVCYQTSSLSLDELRNRIATVLNIDKSVLNNKKYIKKKLCDVYEIAMRSQGKDVFRRPYHIVT